jgi:5-methylcytosine-specific restriction enzyme subunit McrC
MKIPILNIYYLLCYAWKHLQEGKPIPLDIDQDAPLVDLFARVLLNGTAYLLKRGFDRNYVPHEELTPSLRGRLDFARAIKTTSLRSGRLPCCFDELSYDVIHNRILKATIRRLIRVENLDKGLAEKLDQLQRRLPEVGDIRITNQHFRRVQLHRNNHFYSFLLNVCELIHRNLLVSEKAGAKKFKDFVQDDVQMRALFQAFVAKFYAIETHFAVKSDTLTWQWTSLDTTSEKLLPLMHTDVSLRESGRTIIIDCKFTANQLDWPHGVAKLCSPHLYQLSAYLNNLKERPATRIEGMLLYPKAGEPLTASYQDSNGRLIHIRSIDLGQEWQKIHKALLALVDSPTTTPPHSDASVFGSQVTPGNLVPIAWS